MASLMKITDASNTMLVRGDCRISGRLGWIELLATNWDSNKVHGLSSGRVGQLGSMTFIKGRDNASTWLAQQIIGKTSLDPIKIFIEMSSENGNTISFVLVDAVFNSLTVSNYARGAEEYDVSYQRLSTGLATVRSV